MKIDLRSNILCCLALVLTAVLSAPLLAQNTNQSPEQVLQTYWEAWRSSDWAKVVSLTSPADLQSFRLKAKELFDTTQTIKKPGRFGPDAQLYFGVNTLDEFEKLSDYDLAKTLLPVLLQHWLGVSHLLSASTQTILGRVKESEELIHFVYRSSFNLPTSLPSEEGVKIELVEQAGGKILRVERRGQIMGMIYEIKLSDLEQVGMVTLQKVNNTWQINSKDGFDDLLNTEMCALERVRNSLFETLKAIKKPPVKGKTPQRTKRPRSKN